ncbi:hypothetical protein WAI66_18940, partial [Acinetobacter baumannii]
ELRLYNPLRWKLTGGNLYRDHRKLLLVDGRLGYVGGAGITDEFWEPVSDVSAWREVMVEMDGPVVADWAALFERQWLACLEEKAWKPSEGMTLTRLPPQPGAARGLGRVAYADARQHRDILQSLVRALNGSRRRIWLATPYFLPTWKVRRTRSGWNTTCRTEPAWKTTRPSSAVRYASPNPVRRCWYRWTTWRCRCARPSTPCRRRNAAGRGRPTTG